jgi:catechol 2,3-dioxygenase-like lactoylglutathione lyase family enzyme
MAAAEIFYRDTLGFTLSEEVTWRGQRCLFFRCNTEHHSLALFPLALREMLGLSRHSSCAALGVQLANYRQLREALKFLETSGVKISENIPLELHPGIDHAATITDPDGHTIQLYCAMEQVGWDGKVRPKELRATRSINEWPDTLDGSSNAYAGEPFLGPWG